MPFSITHLTPFVRTPLADPLGPMSQALEELRRMLANLGVFQAFMGVLTPEDASNRIFLSSAPPAPQIPDGDGGHEYTRAQWENHLRPFCLIYTASTAGYRLTRVSRYCFKDHGKLFVELEMNAPSGADTDPETADRVVLNAIGQIANGLANNADQPGYLDIAEITIAAGPSRERFEEIGGTGQYYWTLLEISYGPD